MRTGTFVMSRLVATVVTEDTWTVPIGDQIGQIFRWGRQPINDSAGAYYNVEKPEFGSDWTLRLQWTFLFPKGR